MKIAIATGTRADWGLLRPLAEVLRGRGAEVVVLATNMHADPAYGSLAEIEADGFQPRLLNQCQDSPSANAAEALRAFGAELAENRPDWLVILGDRSEMLAVAQAAVLAGVRIAHIAGGTVSEGAVDDRFRNAISQLADLHLTETDQCARRLQAMGIKPQHIVVTGALGVENALRTLESAKAGGRRLSQSSQKADAKPGGGDCPQSPEKADAPNEDNQNEATRDSRFPPANLLATLHPETNPGLSPEAQAEMARANMQAMLTALGKWMEEEQNGRIILTWPNNDLDRRPQVELMEGFAARWPGRVEVIPSLGAKRYLETAAQASAIVGNSSSAIVETPSLGVPTLDIGSRQRGREHGPGIWHCGTSAEEILEGLHRVLLPDFQALAAKARNPYCRPGTAARMADRILGGLPSRGAATVPVAARNGHSSDKWRLGTVATPRSGMAESPRQPRTLYLITARGGSKGIPDKNLKPMAGRPLVARAIEQARLAGAPDEDICLSTDSREIAAIAEREGLEVPFLRPAHLATDSASSRDVILHALDFHRARGVDYERVVLLQPTSPLRRAEDISGALALWQPDAQMVVSVCEAKTNPYYTAFECDDDGYLRISKGDGLLTRRQDAPEVLEINGAVYVIDAEELRRQPMGRFTRRIPYRMPAERSLDLDTPADWTLAESLLSQPSPLP